MSVQPSSNQAKPRSLARRILSAALRSLLALAVILAVLLVTLFSFEQATLRPLAEIAVERLTGRTFRIEGELDARAGRVVSLRAAGISLANSEWGSAESMLFVGEAEVSIDLAEILAGRYLVENIVVSEARLLFEKNDDGLSNWSMGMGDSDDEPPQPANEPASPLVIPVRRGKLSNIAIAVDDPALVRPLNIQLDRVVHDIDVEKRIRTSLDARIDDRPVSLEALSALTAATTGQTGVKFEVEALVEDTRLKVDGDLDDVFSPERVELGVTLVSPEISKTAETFGLPGVLAGATEIEVRLTPAEDRHLVAVSGNIGDLEIDARAQLEALDSIDGITVDLAAAAPDLAAVVNLPGAQRIPAGAFSIDSKLSLAGGRLVIEDTRVNLGEINLNAEGVMNQFPNPQGTNLNLVFEGDDYLEVVNMFEVSAPEGLQPGPFEVRADLEYSDLDRQTLAIDVKLVGLDASVTGNIAGYPSFVGTRLDYRLSGKDAALLQQLLQRPVGIEGAYSAEGEVTRTATGLDIGSTRVSLGEYRIDVSGRIGNEPLRRDTALALRFEGPDLAGIAALSGYDGFLPAGNATIDATAQARDDGIQVDNLELRFDRSRAKASGFVSLQPGIPGSRIDLSVSTEDIADLVPPEFHGYVQTGQAFALTGSFATDDDHLAIDGLQAKLGEINLDASGRMSMQQPLQDASFEVRARGPDLSAVAPAGLIPYSLPVAPFTLAGGIGMSELGLVLDRVVAEIGSETLQVSGNVPLDDPREGLSLELAAKGDNLGILVPAEIAPERIDQLTTYEAATGIALEGGKLALKGLKFTTELGGISGGLIVSIEDPRSFGQFDLAADGVNLQSLLPTTAQYSPPAEPFKLDALGEWSAERVDVDRGVLVIGGSRIEVQGGVGLQTDQVTTGIVLSARGDSLKDLGQIEGLDFPEQAFRVDARIESDASRLYVRDLAAQVGDSDLRGRFAYEFGEKPNIEIELDSRLLDLASIIGKEDEPNEESEPVAEAKPVTSTGKLIPDLPLPVERLNQMNLKAAINVAELRSPRRVMHNIEIDASLQDGDLRVSQFRAQGVKGELLGRFRITVEGNGIVTSGELDGNEIVLGAGEEAEGGSIFPKQNVRLEFDTAGATSRELAANLNGFAQFTGGQGRLSNNYALGLFGSFFGELLSAINPFVKREPYTAITCFAAYAEIIDGVATINPGAVLQTDKLDVFARGEVNLKTEKIGLRFDTTARQGIGVSLADFVNPFVGVGGTLANPQLGVDPENAIFEGGFAVATGGISVVATNLFRSWFGSKSPCADFAAKAEKHHAERLKQNE